jgi:predicted P-loop ATPase
VKKSTLFRELVGDAWFTDEVTDIGSKDSAIQLQGKWIVELSELDATRKVEVTAYKAWLTRRWDHFRPPYGRRAEDFPRQCVFCASTNKDDWALDDTGMRRFWPVRVGTINLDGIREHRHQLWAEAVFYHAEGELPYLAEPMEQIAMAEQLQRQDMDAWTEPVLTWLSDPMTRSTFGGPTPLLMSHSTRCTLPDILWHCLGILQKDWHNAHKQRVIRILHLAGWKRSANGQEFRRL